LLLIGDFVSAQDQFGSVKEVFLNEFIVYIVAVSSRLDLFLINEINY